MGDKIITIERVKDEVEYYIGRKCSDQEAREIKSLYENNHASLEEIISSYFTEFKL